MTLADMKERHSTLIAEAKGFVAECEKDHGGLTEDEHEHFNELHGTAETLQAAIEDGSGLQNIETFDKIRANAVRGVERRPKSYPRFQDGEGKEIVARAGDQTFSDNPLGGELGQSIHNILRGDIQNVQVGSTDSSGGYLLTPEISTRFIDLARSASVCMSAGAVTLPMNSSELTIAGLTSDPTSHWRPETVAVTSTNLAFNKITLRARTLAAIVPVSIEMLEDATNAGQIIESALQTSMARKLDQAALVGAGAASEPKGIRNHADINTIASVGTPTDYSKFSLAIGDVMAANYAGDVSGLAWINHPRTDDTLDGLQDTTNQPLMPTPRVAQLRRLSTTALPITEGGSSDESVSIVGDFSQLAFGMRTRSVVVRILDAGTATDSSGDSWNANTQLMRHIVAYMRADVAVLRPTFFTALTGITA
ncbi:MAG: phage major capsid protein [Fuerstiella sp.]|nr:phage major capsid protein [Fuerstiella sp.]